MVTVRGPRRGALPCYGYSMGRRRLLELLGPGPNEVGVHIEAGRVTDPDAVARGADLVIARDGVNSGLRSIGAASAPDVSAARNKYIWLGTDKEFTSFTFPFVDTPAGWVWGHAYGYADGASTFVVETTPGDLVRPRLRTLDGTGTIRADSRSCSRSPSTGHRSAAASAARSTATPGPSSSRSGTTGGGSATSRCSATRPTPPTSPSARAPGWPWRTPWRWRTRWPRNPTWTGRCGGTTRDPRNDLRGVQRGGPAQRPLVRAGAALHRPPERRNSPP